MTERTIIQMRNPVTQSIDAVKALLTWRGRAVDPMPSTLEFVNEGEGSRLVLVLSNKKDSYYVVTPTKCSCPVATYHPGQPCKHQRTHFPGPQKSREELEAEGASILAAHNSGARRLARPPEESSIRPAGKWPGGMNGSVDEVRGVA
jgi:hypothetical protein